MLDVSGESFWAGKDDDYARAVAFTPAAFLWVRDKAHLVELPALWVRIPLKGWDKDELADAVEATLSADGCPRPHAQLAGDGQLVVLWALKPLKRPNKNKPEHHHAAYRQILENWRKAAMKLSFALESLGCRPLTAQLADEELVGYVPLPFEEGSPLDDAMGLSQEPPRAVRLAETPTPIVVADVSARLKRFDGRLFDALGIARPRGRRAWLASPTSTEALQPKAPGYRHLAAVKIACAARWDGAEYDAIVTRLRDWASTCASDGTFPFKRGAGDELELIAAWAMKKLKPGGPDKPSAKGQDPKRTSQEAIEEALRAFLASAGGAWSGPKHELAQQVALWRVENGGPGLCPLTTLKRVLGQLKASGALAHSAVHDGRTWRSHWRLTAPPAGPPPSGETSQARVQKGESTWAPGLFPLVDLSSEGAAGERLLPAGGVRGGQGTSPGTAPEPELPTPIHEEPENDRAGRSPRQGRLALPRVREDGSALRRRRRSKARDALPPITSDLVEQLSDVAPTLTTEEREELLHEARAQLRPRPRVLGDFAAALRRRASRLHYCRLREARRPPSSQEVEDRRRRDEERERESFPSLEPGMSLLEILSAARVPLDDRTVWDRAQRLHAEGLHIIPLEPRSKEPATTWTTWQQRQMPLLQLRAKLEELGPAAGLAIICGAASGVVVADLDDKSAVEWAHKHLPPTPWVTRTSRGEHWFYRHPKDPLPTTPPPWQGQLQHEGRYVVAPGSHHPDGGRYRCSGDWSQPLKSLPIFDSRWLVDVAALRSARSKVLKP